MDFLADYEPNFDNINVEPENNVSLIENGENIDPTPNYNYNKRNLLGYKDYMRIARSVAEEMQLHSSKLIYKHPNYFPAIRESIKRYNRLGLTQLNFNDQKCRDNVGFSVRRAVVESRRYVRDMIKVAELQAAIQIPPPVLEETVNNVDMAEPDPTDTAQPDQPMVPGVEISYDPLDIGDIVCVGKDGVALFLARVTNVLPVDSDSHNYIIGSVGVTKFFALCDDGASYSDYQENVISRSLLQKIRYPLTRVHNVMGAFLEVEQRHLVSSLGEENANDRHNNRGCNLAHVANDMVLVDLGDQWSDMWPLVAAVVKVRGKQMRLKWYHGVIDGLYIPYKLKGIQKYQNVSIHAHYFCNFELQDGRLPDTAKDAVKNLMTDYEQMENDD